MTSPTLQSGSRSACRSAGRPVHTAVRVLTASICIASALLFSSQAMGRDFHFDSLATPTGATGTQAAPWPSLGSLPALQPGDRILLRCGQQNGKRRVWRQAMLISTPGVTLTTWGDDCASHPPLLSGALALNRAGGWAAPAPGTTPAAWRYTFMSGDLSAGTDYTRLFLGGQPMQIGRHPNSGYLSIAADSPKAVEGKNGAAYLRMSAADHQDLASHDWLGALLRVRSSRYTIEDFSVASLTVATPENGAPDYRLGLGRPTNPAQSTTSTFNLSTRFGYYFVGRCWMVDTVGEWCLTRDASSNFVLDWLPPDGVQPATDLVEFSVRPVVLTIAAANVTIEGIEVGYGLGKNIQLVNAPNTTIRRVSVTAAGNTGIEIGDHSHGSTVSDSVVAGSRLHAIRFYNADSVNLIGNTITDTANSGDPVTSWGAIWGEAAGGALIQGNTVQRSGYNGIRFPNIRSTDQAAGSRRAQVLANTVEDACLLMDDCGGIYTHAQWSVNPSSWVQGALVAENLVRRVSGGLDGTNADTPIAAGIYLDDYSANVDLRSNIVESADLGLLLHNTRDNVVSGNTVLLPLKACLELGNGSNSQNQPIPLVGISVRGNRCTASARFARSRLTPHHYMMRLANAVEIRSSAPFSFGPGEAQFSDNHYESLYGSSLFVAPFISTGSTSSADRAGWRSRYPADAANAEPAYLLRLYDWTPRAGRTELMNHGNVDNGLGSWNLSASQTVRWRSAEACGSEVPCLSFINSDANTRATASPFNPALYTASGSAAPEQFAYLLRFSVRSPVRPEPFSVEVRHHGPDYETMWSTNLETAGSAWHEHAIAFLDLDPVTRLSRLDLVSRLPSGAHLDFKSISVIPVSLTVHDGAATQIVISNRSPEPAPLACPVSDGRCTQLVGADGLPVQWPLTLPPLSARALTWSVAPGYGVRPAATSPGAGGEGDVPMLPAWGALTLGASLIGLMSRNRHLAKGKRAPL